VVASGLKVYFALIRFRARRKTEQISVRLLGGWSNVILNY